MSWKKINLGSLIENFSVRAKDYGGSEGLEFLGVSNDDGIVTSKYAAEEKGEDYKIIEKGCFAYNPYRINVGSIAYCDRDIKALISPAYVIFKTKPNTIKNDLLLKFLKSSEGLRQIKFYGRGTVRQALRFDDLCKIEISIPSFESQEDLISNIQKIEIETSRLSTELSHQVNLVKKLRQHLLQDAIQGKLVAQAPTDEPANVLLQKIKTEKEQLIKDKKLKKEKELPIIKPEEIPFEIPENWVWCRLGEIAYITSGSTPSQDAFVQNGIPYLKMYNLKNQKIDFYFKPQYIKEDVHNGQLKRCRAYPGDILMNIVGPPLGKIAIIPDHLIECNFNQAAVLIRPMFKEMNFYMFWYLNEMSEIKAIDTKGVAGQANISVTQAHNMKIPLPPLAEQHRIVQKLEQLMQTCDALEASIKQSQQQNDHLLQQVLREALTKKVEPENVA
ncbi:MAG: restriction endonuclease subunit S [Mucilaginibacter sp.]